MEKAELEKRFGLFADYYGKFLSLSDEELRICVADLMRSLGVSLEQFNTKLKVHSGAFEHKRTDIPNPNMGI